MPSAPTRQGRPWRVQTARGLPHVSNDAGWTTQAAAEMTGLTLGHGPRLSTATLSWRWERLRLPGEDATTTLPQVLPEPGWLVRLQERTATKPDTWATRFLGVVTALTEAPDERRLALTLTDVQVLLGRVALGRGWELASDGVTVIDPGHLPIFNGLPGAGGVLGDRSAAQVTTGFSQVFVHDRSGAGVAWSVRDILELLLREGIHASLPGARSARGLEWDLGTFPARVPPTPQNLNLAGRTPAECLALLLPPSQGYSWRTRLRNDGVILLDVIDTTVAGTPRALTSVWEQDLVYQEDLEGFDYLQVLGEQPVYIVRLYYQPSDPNSSLIPDGWTNDAATEATLWAHADAGLYAGAAWRRWRLNPAWNGSSLGAAGQPLAVYERDTVPNADEHYTTPTGGAYVMPNARGLVLEATLPDDETFSGLAGGPRARSQVAAGPVGSEVSVTDRIAVQVFGGGSGTDLAEAAGIALGGSPQAAAELCALIGRADTINGRLIVTLAIRHPRPLCAAWLKPRSQWPFGNPRVRTVRVPQAHLWIRWGGISGSGATIRDDTPRLRELRDQLAARYAIQRARAAWVERSTVVTDLLPGDVISTITTPAGRTTASGPTTRPVNAPVATITIRPAAVGYDTAIDVVPISL